MIRRFLSLTILTLTGGLILGGSLRADTTNPAPDFKEVYDLLRAHLPGATDGTLNRAAVAGLVSQFPGKVALVGGTMDTASGSPGATALVKSAIVESNVLYLRVRRVAASLPEELAAAGKALTATNPVAGAVLDLRYADGDDYGAAQETAGLLAAKNSSRPFPGPLVVLVNGRTRGAAEALFAALRDTGAVLSLGSPTAGAAMTFKEFVLKDGEKLLIATTPVKVDGQAMPVDGLKPDIAVAVNADDERTYYDYPYGTPAQATNTASAATNSFYLPYVDRTSEADLVRQKQQDGKIINLPPIITPTKVKSQSDDDDGAAPAPPAARSARVVRDPVLARAVDLVKGLAVMRAVRP